MPQAGQETICNHFFASSGNEFVLHYFHYTEAFHLPSRRTPEYVILQCLQGQIVIREEDRMCTLLPGEIMISNPDLPRRTVYLPVGCHPATANGHPTSCEGWAIMVTRSQMCSLLRETDLLPGDGSPLFGGKINATSMGSPVRRALQVCQQNLPGVKSYIQAWLHQFAMEVLWAWPAAGISSRCRNQFEALPRASYIRAVEFMQQCGKDGFSVEVLSKAIGMSPAALRRRMYASTGSPPLQLFNGILLERARRKLEAPCCSVKEAAYDLGFSSASQFSHFFRRMTKLSPAAYQDQALRKR